MSELISDLFSFLPQEEGLLPKWLLLVRTPHRAASIALLVLTLAPPPGLDYRGRELNPNVFNATIHQACLLGSP